MMQSTAARNWPSLWTAASAEKATIMRADGEGGAVWLQNPAQAKGVADQLVKAHPAHVQAIFYRSAPGNSYTYVQDSPTGWLVNHNVATALQHLVDTTAGQNGPDLWVLYRENYTVVSRNVSGLWKGTHGGATWKVQHVPLVISGPDVKKGATSHFGARAIDIAPTMERLLGLPSIHRDGIVLADALLDATHAEIKGQQEIAPSVNADVKALQQQSSFDSTGLIQWPKLPAPPYRCGSRAPSSGTCKSTGKTATNS